MRYAPEMIKGTWKAFMSYGETRPFFFVRVMDGFGMEYGR